MKLTSCMYRQLLLAALAVGCASTVYAQPGRGGFPGVRGGDLLSNDDVIKELELVPEQQEKLADLRENMRDEMRDMFSGLRDLSPEERREQFQELREKMAGLQEKMQVQINDILLPQQRDRLDQIRFQMRVRRGGSTGSLTSDTVVEALDISEEQLEQMREKEEEVREELAEKIREAQEDARKELLSVLSPEQRKKYDDLMGKPFEFTRPEGFGGFRGGDDGNRGGFRGRTRRGRTQGSED